MSTKKAVIDTNVILRFLVRDNEEQFIKGKTLFETALQNSLVIPDLVITEIVFVLLSFYKLPKEEVIEKITLIIDFEKFDTNEKLLKKTLEIYRENNISFVDAYLGALNLIGKNSKIYSFDKRLNKINGIVSTTP